MPAKMPSSTPRIEKRCRSGLRRRSVRAADAWVPPVLTVSSLTGDGILDLIETVEKHRAYTSEPMRAAATKRTRHRHWVADAVKVANGVRGLAAVNVEAALAREGGPFAAIARLLDEYSARIIDSL